MFADETRIGLRPHTRLVRVWRSARRYEEHRYVQEIHPFAGSVMFWAAIMMGRLTPLIPIYGTLTGPQYLHEILQMIVRPYRLDVDDNARLHRTLAVSQYLQRCNINRMQWAAQSPDMNAIEHAWDMLKVAIALHPNPLDTLQDLTEAAIEEWDLLPRDQLDGLIESMQHRMEELIHVRRGHTHRLIIFIKIKNFNIFVFKMYTEKRACFGL